MDEIQNIIARLEKIYGFDKLYQGGQGGLDIRGKYKTEMDQYLESIKYLKSRFSSSPVLLEQVLRHPTVGGNSHVSHYLCERIHKWFPNDTGLMGIINTFQGIAPEPPKPAPVNVPSRPFPNPSNTRPPAPPPPEVILKYENEELKREIATLNLESQKLYEMISHLRGENTELLKRCQYTEKENGELLKRCEAAEAANSGGSSADAAKKEKMLSSYKTLTTTILGIFSVLFMNKSSVSFAEFSSALNSVMRHLKNHNKSTGDNIDISALEDLIK
ncbi:MAG: hypothetical protein K1Y36_05560 [Blastocatellia bacterium]|nr:hypothetical protein [Blastocatellia bacterium]